MISSCQMADGCCIQWNNRGKSGSTGSGCRVTPGGGDPRESATENIPPGDQVWVKWCVERTAGLVTDRAW